MKADCTLLLALALMGYTAAYNIPPGFQNVLETTIEEMMPNDEKYTSEELQATNRKFMNPNPRIQESQVLVLPPIPSSSEHSISTDSLRIGQAVEVLYLPPSEGFISVSLESTKGDIPLSISVQYESNSEKNTLVIKSKTAKGQWQHEIHSCGCALWDGLVDLQIEIGTDSFIIKVNGDQLKTYPYQDNLNYSIVTKVKWFYDEAGAVKRARLKFLGIDIEM